MRDWRTRGGNWETRGEGGRRSSPSLGPVRGSPTRTLKPLRCAPGWSAARPIRRVALWRCCPLGPGHLGRRGGPGGGVVRQRQGQLCWQGSKAGGGPQRLWSQSPPACWRRSHCSGSHLSRTFLRRNNKGHLWARACVAHSDCSSTTGSFHHTDEAETTIWHLNRSETYLIDTLTHCVQESSAHIVTPIKTTFHSNKGKNESVQVQKSSLVQTCVGGT